MTISSSIGRISYVGNGATTEFATNFKLLDEDHVEVYVDNVLQTITTDYTVSGINNSSATVTFVTAPASSTSVVLKLSVPAVQDTDLVDGQAFAADTVERALDIGIQIDQGILEELSRTLKAPVDAPSDFSGQINALTPNYILRVNADGDAFEVSAPAAAAGVGTLGSQESDNVDITGGTVAGITTLGVSGNITVSGTVDGVDLSALESDVDGFPDRLKNLTEAEITQLENIGTSTISAIQWGYLGSLTDSPISGVVGDTSPELGGDLDVNGNSIISSSNGDISITPNGTGSIVLGGLTWPSVDGSNGQVLATDGSGNLSFTAGGGGGGGGGLSNVVEDTTPQLGGMLDVNGNSIGDGSRELVTFTEDASAVNHVNIENEATGSGPIISSTGDDTNVDLNLAAKGTGSVNISGISHPTSDGTSGQALTTDGSGQLSFSTINSDLVDDTTPQLGGMLDVNGNAIGDGTNELVTFTEDASAVNHINIENEATGSGPTIRSAGSDTNVDLNLEAKGTGDISLGNLTFDADQTVGAGQDDHVLTYDNTSGKISLEAAASGGGDFELISTATAATEVSTVEFTSLNTSTYTDYKLVGRLSNSTATSNEILWLDVSTDGGSTWSTTSNFYPNAAIGRAGRFGGGHFFETNIYHLDDSSNPTSFTSNYLYRTTSTDVLRLTVGSVKDTAEAENAIRVRSDTGAHIIGTISLYGRKA